MNPSPLQNRSSGLLAHITSLPSQFGIGDIGLSSYSFIDFLVKAGQSYWQFLPVVPTSSAFDNSPYMSSSAFAGSPLLISPDLLCQHGLIKNEDVDLFPVLSDHTTQYHDVTINKTRLLEKAYLNFDLESNQFVEFLNNTPWVIDYSLFMTIKEVFSGSAWFDWPDDLARCRPKAIKDFTVKHRARIDYFRFEQFEFYRQWILLRKYAKKSTIQLFGDIPIYVGLDSADVWANQSIFCLDRKSLQPTHVSGVPPDYFSETGQRWGNPLYQWHSSDPKVREDLKKWWVQRFRAIYQQVDIARIDHFRGFESYWSVPAEEETAINGSWEPGPGIDFFHSVFETLGPLKIIAEDLGVITPQVEKLRDDLGFPGMKILQFAFDSNEENSFLPWNYQSPNSVIYTGTHDNDTTLGWFLGDKLSDTLRKRIKKSANASLGDHRAIHDDMIFLAFSSTSKLCILPIQDIFGFGNDCRMNIPGTSEGNWSWRCLQEFFTDETAKNLRQKTEFFGRGRKKGNLAGTETTVTNNDIKKDI